MTDYKVLNIDPIEALCLDRPSTYGVERVFPDGRKFVYCYTAITTFLKGCVACLTFTGGGTIGQNPRATVPATTTGILHKWGICCEGVTAAGGIWVQTFGHCDFARVDGTTDTTVGMPLQAVNTGYALITDGASTVTADTIAFAETVETDTLTAQGNATYGAADNTVFLLDRWAALG